MQLVFLLLVPDREHGLQLQILAALAQGLSSDPVRERLTSARSDADVWAALGEVLYTQNITGVTPS